MMIVEVRTYTVKSGRRDEFLRFFAARAAPLQRALGIGVIGPWIDLEHPDRFVWMRSFASIEERERLKARLYDGPEWTGELEAIAMPMLDDFASIVTEIAQADLPGLAPPAPHPRGKS